MATTDATMTNTVTTDAVTTDAATTDAMTTDATTTNATTTKTRKSYTFSSRDTSCGKGMVKDIPMNAKVVTKTLFKKMVNKAEAHDRLLKVLTKKKRFNWCEKA